MTDQAPPSDPPGDDELIAVWWSLTEAVTTVSAQLSRALERRDGPSLPAFDVLLRLFRAPGHRLPLTDLAAELGLTAGGFTRLVDRLHQDVLVRREPAPLGRRDADVVLTAHGRDVTAVLVDAHVSDLRRSLLEPLGTQGLRALEMLARGLREQGPGDHRR